MGKIEGELRSLFAEVNVDDHSAWEEVRVQLMDKSAYMAVTEEQAVKMFKDYQKDLSETCLHNHGKKKNKKRKKKKKGKDRTRSVSAKSESRSPISSEPEETYTKKSKKKRGTPSLSPSPARRSASPMRSPSPPRRRGRDTPSPPPKRKDREKSSDDSIEEGELSEDELERKRMQLLKQLQEDD